MNTLTVTSRRQVTLRREVMQHLGVKPGDKIEIHLLPGGRATIEPAQRTGSIDGFIGLLAGRTAKIASIEEIGAAAADDWASAQRSPAGRPLPPR